MSAQYQNGDVVAHCPDCGARSTFESRKGGGTEYGSIVAQAPWYDSRGIAYAHRIFRLLRCASCGRGGLATIAGGGGSADVLIAFSPVTVQPAPLPKDTPRDIVAEVREAERCAAVGGWRAASAMLRSALEKTLTANGYDEAKLVHKIDAAAADTVITDARKQRAHDEVRVLGNDVLHDDWRVVDETEYDLSHLYTQRVIEDFYDSRAQVEATLKAKGRIKAKPTP